MGLEHMEGTTVCYEPGLGRRTKYLKPVRNEPVRVPTREPWKETKIGVGGAAQEKKTTAKDRET